MKNEVLKKISETIELVWKNGKLTELNASFNRSDNMKFNIVKHK